MQMIATNVRHPRDFRGDLAAMIGSAHVGERRFLALASEFGWETTHEAIEAVLDGAERQTRAVIAQWQDGVYFGEALLDDDGRGNEDIHIRATVTKSGSDLKIDLTDSHPQVASFINSSYPNMYSSVVVALSYLIDPDTPKNDGTFRPLEIIAKPGTVVWANPGAPVTLATNHCAQEILEAIIKALAPSCPERAMAGWGRRFRIAIQGSDPRRAHPMAMQAAARSSGISSRRGPAAARRLPATAGPAPANGRPPAASSSAASKSPRCAFRCSSRRTNSARIRAAPGSIAAVPAGSSKWSSRPPSRRSATRPATASDTAPAAFSAAKTDCRTAILLYSGNEDAAPDPDQGNRPRDPPRRPSRPRIRRRRRLGRPRETRPGGDRGRCRERVRDERGSPKPLSRTAGEGGPTPKAWEGEGRAAKHPHPARFARATLSRMRERDSGAELAMYRIGIDVGGTFTDLVAIDAGGATTLAKVPSTPAGPLARRARRARTARRPARTRPRRAAGSRPTGSCTARPSRPTRCSNARAPAWVSSRPRAIATSSRCARG